MGLFFFFLGLVVGSFLNVCIFRLPRRESVVSPPSHCPHCYQRLGVIDLIPVFSYLFLKGSCRFCHQKISIRYPLVELMSGFISLFLYGYYAPHYLSLASALFFAYLLIVVAFIDLDHRIIPDELSIVGVIIGFLFSFILPDFSPLMALGGLFAGGGALLLVALISRGGMGGGDVKLMAMMGTFLGWNGALGTIFVGAFLGSIGGLLTRKGLKGTIPFGPFLALAGLIVLLYGQQLWEWYLNFLPQR